MYFLFFDLYDWQIDKYSFYNTEIESKNLACKDTLFF